MGLNIACVVLILPATAFAVPSGAAKEIDQKKVDRAIEAGAKYLERVVNAKKGYDNTFELILLTLAHAGYGEDNETVKTLLRKIFSRPLSRTYNVSLLAAALKKLNKERYYQKLLACAEFLIYNQARNGQWNYGKPVPDNGKIFTRREVVEGTINTGTEQSVPDENRAKTAIDVNEEAYIKREPEGDNSNTHYALLGVRACAEAGIIFPKGMLELSRRWWYRCQNSDGGWSYSPTRDNSKRRTAGSYGSMTCAGVSSLSVCLWLLGEDWQKDDAVKRGLNWLAENFKVDQNPSAPKQLHHYYYLYAVERAGMIYETEFFGGIEWYYDGALYLLRMQRRDGSWFGGEYKAKIGKKGKTVDNLTKSVWETCFAILFLRRATEPLRQFISTGSSEN